ncbi:MAG: hypothetical protein R2722_15570 [Tessaracoccus sp.]
MQQTFEVVGVLDMPGHLRRARPQQRLHGVEQGGVDERFMRARMQGTLVADNPGVVGVRQEFVERVLAECLGRALRRRHGEQAACGQVAQQSGDRGFPGRVSLERPPDQRGAFGIDLDSAYLAALFVGLADVEVANGRTHRCAALGDLLRQAFGDFGGEVAAVELGDGGHDAVHEHPRGRLVYRLSGGDERDPGTYEGFVNLHVVGPVAGEPVELVHEAELHARRGDERQHVLEPIPIRRPRRLTRVHELPHDPRAQLVRFPRVGFALRGDREAFLGAAALGLLPRRDTQVGDRQQHRHVVGDAGRRGGEGGSSGGAHAMLRSLDVSGSTLPRASDTGPRESAVSSSGGGRS